MNSDELISDNPVYFAELDDSNNINTGFLE